MLKSHLNQIKHLFSFVFYGSRFFKRLMSAIRKTQMVSDFLKPYKLS